MHAASQSIPTISPTGQMTAEEAAGFSRRIRVESKLSRVTLVGTLLGLICGAAAIWPFISSDGYMAGSLVDGDGFGVLSFFPGWLLAGMLPLLAFYSARLQFR